MNTARYDASERRNSGKLHMILLQGTAARLKKFYFVVTETELDPGDSRNVNEVPGEIKKGTKGGDQ